MLSVSNTATHCNTPQLTATHRSTPQHNTTFEILIQTEEMRRTPDVQGVAKTHRMPLVAGHFPQKSQ